MLAHYLTLGLNVTGALIACIMLALVMAALQVAFGIDPELLIYGPL
jgi:hypothetical protein